MSIWITILCSLFYIVIGTMLWAILDEHKVLDNYQNIIISILWILFVNLYLISQPFSFLIKTTKKVYRKKILKR